MIKFLASFALFSRMILLQIGGAHCNARSALTRVRHKTLSWPLCRMSPLWASSVRTPVTWWSDLWDGTLGCGHWHRYLEITGRTPGQTSNSSVQTLTRPTRHHGSPGQQRRPPDLASRADPSGLSPPPAVLNAARRSALWPPPGVRGLRGLEDAELSQNSPRLTLRVPQVGSFDWQHVCVEYLTFISQEYSEVKNRWRKHYFVTWFQWWRNWNTAWSRVPETKYFDETWASEENYWNFWHCCN